MTSPPRMARRWHCAPLTIFCFSALVVAHPALFAQDAMSALTRAERAYRSMQTLRASFEQTLENPMLGAPVVTTGRIMLSPPSRFSMVFAHPEGDRVVCDGTWLWVYAPSSAPNQVIRRPIPDRGAATPNLLAQFVDRPLEHYLASYIGPESLGDDTVDVVRLVPRRDDDPFTEAQIAVSRSSGLVLRLVVWELSRQKRTLVFDQLQVDATIPAAEFQFRVPGGVRVVTP